MSTLPLGGTALADAPIVAPATTYTPPPIISPGGLPDVVGTPTLPRGAGSLDVGFPVAPGDPGLLDALSGTLGHLEGMLGDHAATIQTAPQCAPTWTGEAQTAYANLSSLVAAHFHHAAGTAADARSALKRWSAELARCQREGMVAVTEAQHWLAEIKTQQQALATAQGDLTTAQGAVTAAQTNLAAAASPGHSGAATAHLVQAVGAAQNTLAQAQTAAQTARTKLEHAQHELALWQSRGRMAWQDAEHAAETATGTLAPLFLVPPPLAGLPVPLSPTPPFAGPADPNCQDENGTATANASSGLPDKLRSLAGNIAGISPGLAGALLILAKALEDAEAELPAAEDGLNLASEGRTAHILEGDATGGGHLWPGLPGKTPFPESWSASRVMTEISEVASDPAATRVVQGGRTIITATRDGVEIRVIIDNNTGDIVTGYPTNLPRNP